MGAGAGRRAVATPAGARGGRERCRGAAVAAALNSVPVPPPRRPHQSWSSASSGGRKSITFLKLTFGGFVTILVSVVKSNVTK